MTQTFSELTMEHLGSNTNEADLAAFVRACELAQTNGESEEETIDRLWGQGDWMTPVRELVAYDPDHAETLSADDLADYAEAIRLGDHDA